MSLLWEIVPRPVMARVPEPHCVMEDADRVSDYARATAMDSSLAATHLFVSAHACQVFAGCREVIDLGCGPGTQLAQLAELCPGVSFTGVELSACMIGQAKDRLRRLGLGNLRLVQDDITRLDRFAESSVDGVLSSFALHHLPSLEALSACYTQVARVLRPGGAILLVDFGRLHSPATVRYFAYRNQASQPPLFSQDTEHSILAAFSLQEQRRVAAARLPPQVKLHGTFAARLAVMLRTETRGLSPEVKASLHARRSALLPRFRRDLDDLRLFFRLGGLRQDPFA